MTTGGRGVCWSRWRGALGIKPESHINGAIGGFLHFQAEWSETQKGPGHRRRGTLSDWGEGDIKIAATWTRVGQSGAVKNTTGTAEQSAKGVVIEMGVARFIVHKY